LAELESGLASGSLHPNEAKMRLAKEIVSIFHSLTDAQAAQERWDKVFRSGGDGIPEDIPQVSLSGAKRILDILRDNEMVTSGKEAKRLAEGGGIRMNSEAVSDVEKELTTDMLPVVLQVGKRKFLRVTE
jgi:tyrosyl-tRNA synthetase